MGWYILRAAVAAGFVVWAGAAGAAQITDRVKAVVDQMIAVQEDQALQGPQQAAARNAKVKGILAQSFNFSAMARRSLGKEWGKLNADQRKEFTEVFGDLFVDSYSSSLLPVMKRETVTFAGETVKENTAVVKTTIQRPNRPPLPVDYRLLRSGERWQAYDVVIDGLSLLQNYRDSFANTIRRSSFENLLEQMKAQRKVLGGPSS